jgi:Putative zinc-finger
VTKSFPPHPSEVLLEEYVFHRLPEAHAAQVEEHLLICEGCQEAVQELDAFVSTMKAAAAGPPTKHWWPWSTGTRMGVASTLAASLLVLVVFRTGPSEDPAPVAVRLSSIRGFEVLSEAPAGKPLQLRIEAPDLTTGQAYRIAVVDAGGGSVWTGTATYGDGKLLEAIPKRLVSGVYWVRLYDAEERQLREFGMSVK